ncbi:MAG: RsbRD N-terminal domain-containing protein [Candidatus Omnitrophica bacterium]|nr:RsbRD N-terminal domain-containing protein [Candidatus Omnitrophota bacterium]
MNLNAYLRQKESAILEQWLQEMLAQYPADASGFFRKERDPFANPVGDGMRKGVRALLHLLLDNGADEDFIQALDSIVRIKAVQEFTPSEAVAFVFLLKPVIRRQLSESSNQELDWNEILLLESRIDRMALIAFNIYMQCRESLYKIKADQVRNMSFKLLQRSNLITELDEAEAAFDDPDCRPSCKTQGGCQP